LLIISGFNTVNLAISQQGYKQEKQRVALGPGNAHFWSPVGVRRRPQRAAAAIASGRERQPPPLLLLLLLYVGKVVVYNWYY